MRKELLMRRAAGETTVAVIEDGRLAELYAERESDRRVVGNIYKGIVKNILPGMQAAFVDIGLEKNAFLYVDDAGGGADRGGASGAAGAAAGGMGGANGAAGAAAGGMGGRNGLPGFPIQSLLKEGQELMVQITKEPSGSKGARITAQITLPGCCLVLMPAVNRGAVSHRIQSEAERRRLQALADELKPEAMGLIVRTIGEGASREELMQDRQQLLVTWEGVRKRFGQGGPKGLIYRDTGLCQRVLRDIFSADVSRLMVDSRALYNEVLEYLEMMKPQLKRKVFVCNMEELFDKYSVEQEMAAALSRKVWMKNGSYLVFDRTEALTVVDVNTGKYVGSTNLKDTILRTNTEAALEIARQLRIRNIGGIIIIDFIDMEEEKHRQKVLEALTRELDKDKVRTRIMGFTALGLVEITRKKVRQSLDSILETGCPHCGGKGRVPAQISF